jgi:RES domain-containing protein
MAVPVALVTWRLETTRHFATWQTAEGAFLFGGRWSSPNRRVLYTSLDPSTAILEVAVHKGLNTLDAVAHTLIQIEILTPKRVFKVDPASVPNANWLRPGTVSKAQQLFGDALLKAHPMVRIPSVVSTHSWNLLIDVDAAARQFKLRSSEAFALDPRLNPA